MSQTKYARNLVQIFGLDSAKHTKTTMNTILKLTKDDARTPLEHSLYCSMIGSLLHLTASRPNISYSVGVFAYFQANPKMFHLNVVKRIIINIHGTCKYGIQYFLTPTCVAGFSDNDWARNVVDRKSTSKKC